MSNLFFIILHNNLTISPFIISHKSPLTLQGDERGISLVNTAFQKTKNANNRPLPKNSLHFPSKRRNNAPGRPKKNGRKYQLPPDNKNSSANARRRRMRQNFSPI